MHGIKEADRDLLRLGRMGFYKGLCSLFNLYSVEATLGAHHVISFEPRKISL